MISSAAIAVRVSFSNLAIDADSLTNLSAVIGVILISVSRNSVFALVICLIA
jgi:hypothetical protein